MQVGVWYSKYLSAWLALESSIDSGVAQEEELDTAGWHLFTLSSSLENTTYIENSTWTNEQRDGAIESGVLAGPRSLTHWIDSSPRGAHVRLIERSWCAALSLSVSRAAGSGNLMQENEEKCEVILLSFFSN